MNFSGKTAIVTGASRGIGKAIAIALGKHGCNVVVNYFNTKENAKKIAEEIIKAGGNAIHVKADVRSKKEVNEMVAETLRKFGRIDFLVNNAGITKDNFFANITESDWDNVMDVNLKGTYNCVKAVLPIMTKQGFGRIVNSSSVSGQIGNIGQANYAASKAAILGFSKSLAKEVAASGITVNVVAPGIINTDMHRTIPEKVLEKFLGQIPMKRFGKPEEVAGAVLFLLSEEAAYITGQTINVNGGLFTG
ncbi:MAG TPA: 3-oxoacyl-[acyl-carrier-protein] reductase [archaeon]|nr:3-oxoacyl-[acyl-carrier-protein] reductase [archaeon]